MGRDIPALIPRTGRLLGAALLSVPLAVPVLAAPGVSAFAAAPAFTERDVVSDIPGRAELTDPNVVNPWGLALSPTSPLWVANNGTGVATLYAGGANGGAVTKVPLTVTIPGGAPTGQVFNDTGEFVVSSAAGSGPARFLFASEVGEITGWNPAAAPTTAIVAASPRNAVYKGMALLHTGAGAFLLAADFHHARIDVFDGHFNLLKLPGRLFTDPDLPEGYAPFDVAVIGNGVYVAYAKQGEGIDEQAGPGLGFVDKYNAFGLLQQRIASHGALNAPWGLAIAPASFGAFAGRLLVGNFGDGHISVYDADGGGFIDMLRDSAGNPIVIDGLWALLPGTANTGGTDAVWFSAGINDENDGLVGLIRPAA